MVLDKRCTPLRDTKTEINGYMILFGKFAAIPEPMYGGDSRHATEICITGASAGTVDTRVILVLRVNIGASHGNDSLSEAAIPGLAIVPFMRQD